MSETEIESQQKPSLSIWKRLVIVCAVFVLLMVALGIGQYYLTGSNAKDQLSKATKELDESDPNWRLEEIDQHREQPPDAKNSGPVVRSAHALIPKGAPNAKVMERFDLLPPPPELLDDERAELLNKEMISVATALAEARKLADLPAGRHALVLNHNPIATLLPHVQETREIANILRFDALNLAQQNKAGESLRSCRAALSAGRSIGDEMFMISQLVRSACATMSADAIERTLALGEPPVEELASVQELLGQEADHPSAVIGLRGERAMLHALLSRLADGSVSSKGLFDGVFRGGVRSWDDWMMSLDARGMARRDHPRVLALMNKAIEIARLPAHEQFAAENALAEGVKRLPSRAIIARAVMPAPSSFLEGARRKQAQMRCLQTLLAVERHRREKGTWPGALAELTPKLLKSVPLDPYDGKPLRYKKLADGVIVYSIGKDRTDNGGNIDRAKSTTPGTDLGYQLWDVKHRRQPAKPAPLMPK